MYTIKKFEFRVVTFELNQTIYLHKIGARLLGKLTICIDNAGPLRGHCIVAMKTHQPKKYECSGMLYYSDRSTYNMEMVVFTHIMGWNHFIKLHFH